MLGHFSEAAQQEGLSSMKLVILGGNHRSAKMVSPINAFQCNLKLCKSHSARKSLGHLFTSVVGTANKVKEKVKISL
jgi:hypothetical protein